MVTREWRQPQKSNNILCFFIPEVTKSIISRTSHLLSHLEIRSLLSHIFLLPLVSLKQTGYSNSFSTWYMYFLVRLTTRILPVGQCWVIWWHSTKSEYKVVECWNEQQERTNLSWADVWVRDWYEEMKILEFPKQVIQTNTVHVGQRKYRICWQMRVTNEAFIEEIWEILILWRMKMEVNRSTMTIGQPVEKTKAETSDSVLVANFNRCGCDLVKACSWPYSSLAVKGYHLVSLGDKSSLLSLSNGCVVPACVKIHRVADHATQLTQVPIKVNYDT